MTARQQSPAPTPAIEALVEKAARDAGRNCPECKGLVFLAACVDCMEAALRAVAEEAAREERAKLRQFYEGTMRSIELARPLCPDHRDKQRGTECMVCMAERRARAAEGGMG